jgi:hypothetical protein
VVEAARLAVSAVEPGDDALDVGQHLADRWVNAASRS